MIGHFYKLPFSFVEPEGESAAMIRDADGQSVAMMMWPSHPPEDTDAAVAETYAVARAFVASLDRLAALEAGRSAEVARVVELEREARRFADCYPESSDGRNTFVIFADKIAALAKREPGSRHSISNTAQSTPAPASAWRRDINDGPETTQGDPRSARRGRCDVQ